MSDARPSRVQQVLRATELYTLHRRLLTSTWETSFLVAFVFIISGIAIVVACGNDICVDWLWHEVTLLGGFSGIGVGAAAYLIDLMLHDRDIPSGPVAKHAYENW